MVTNITYEHFCNLGALNNPSCFSSGGKYYYHGNLSEACWQGWRNRSPQPRP